LAKWAQVAANGNAKSSASVQVTVLTNVVFITLYLRVVCIKVDGWIQPTAGVSAGGLAK
jgi:hypothetical protein